jgi:hypothetical protein
MVTIQSPDSEDSFVQGTQVEFSASATDPVDGNLSAQIQWKSSSGELLHVGDSFQISTLGLGTHTFTASVTDSENASASTWVRIEVTPDPALDVLRGTYQREPVQNAWHAGEITREGDLLRWTNQAGVSWILVPDLANQVLHTKSDNPYYGDPAARDFQLIWTDGLLTGFRFYSETYTRPLEQACFSAIFAQVVWHPSRSPDIFERFCAGPNPQERIACFEGQLQQHDDPDRAVRVCGDSGPGEDPLGAPGTYLTDADLEAFKSFRHKRSVTVEGADWAVSSWLGDELCLQRNTCSDGHIQGAASWDNGRGWVFAHDNVGINSIGGAMYVVCRDGSCGVHRLTTYSKDEDWDHPSGIQVAGNILAIAADRTYFVDLSNEASPRQLSCTILDKGAAGITYHPFHKRWFVVVGGRLYVSSNHLLEDCGFEKVGHDIQTSEGISQIFHEPGTGNLYSINVSRSGDWERFQMVKYEIDLSKTGVPGENGATKIVRERYDEEWDGEGKDWPSHGNSRWGATVRRLEDGSFSILTTPRNFGSSVGLREYSRAAPSELSDYDYEVAIDCNHSDLDHTGTKARISVEFWAGDTHVQTKYRDGVSCSSILPDPGFTTKSPLTVTHVKVRTDGDDAFYIDELRLLKENEEFKQSGTDNGKGWCLSTDPDDTNRDWKGYINGSCVSEKTFDVYSDGLSS